MGRSPWTTFLEAELWLDQLRPESFWFLVRRRSGGSVRYLRGRFSGWQTRVLTRLGYRLEPVTEGLGDLRDENGLNLSELGEEACYDCGRELAARMEPATLRPLLGARYDERRLRYYLEKSPTFENTYWLACDLARMAYLKPQHAVLVAAAAPGDEFLAARLGVRCEFYPVRENLVRLVREGVAGLGLLAGAALSAFVPRKTPPARPCVAVQAINGADPTQKNDLFWLSEVDPERVLVYFHRADVPASAENVGQYARAGVRRWVRWSNLLPGRDARFRRDAFRYVRLLLDLGGKSWWERFLLVRAARWFIGWSAFAREQHVGAHVHLNIDAKCVPMALALEREGGLDVSYQWSANHFHIQAYSRTVPQHIFLAWGPNTLEDMRRTGAMPHLALVTGHTNAGLVTEAMREAARERRRALGSDTVYALFDNSYNQEIYYTRKGVAELYRAVLAYAAEKGTGLVLKPKNPATTLEFTEIQDLLPQVEGRTVSLPFRTLPMDAALACDCVIGLGYCSAVVEAALSGVPAIFYDLADLLQHPIRAKTLRHVANRPDELVALLAAGPQPWSREELRGFDPFLDEGGGKRIGQVLTWVLQALDEGKDPLNEVARRYGQAWGEEHVARWN